MTDRFESIKEFILDTAALYGINEYAVEVWNKMEELQAPFSEIVEFFRLLFNLSRKEIENCDVAASERLSKKFPYFGLVSDWDLACNLRHPYAPMNYLKAIFSDNGDVIPPEHYNDEMAHIIRPRCDEKVRRINELFPNTFPEDQEVAFFFMDTDYFARFDKIYDLLHERNRVKARYTELFFDAVKYGLNEMEIGEFNLYSAHFNVIDKFLPDRFIDYDYVVNNRNIILEEASRAIDDYVVFKKDFKPWIARAFYQEPSFADAYILNHPEEKREIRTFLMQVSSYFCQYLYIVDPETYIIIDQFDFQFDAEDLGLPDPYMLSDEIVIEKEKGEIKEEDKDLINRYLPMVASSAVYNTSRSSDLADEERAKRRLERGWNHG